MTMSDAATDGPATPPPTGGDLWSAAVDALMDVLRQRALPEISLSTIAAVTASSEDALREQFVDFDGLVLATLEVWGARRVELAQGTAKTFGTVAYLRKLLELSVIDQACSRLVLASASLAASPGSSSALPLQQMWVQFHATVQRSLARDIEQGREPATMAPSHGTEQLLALYEGLQFQWFLRPHMDLLSAWDRATTRLRSGWSEAYAEPLWQV